MTETTHPRTRFDDDYRGARWRYGLRYRPLGSWNVPDGWIIGSDRPHPEYPFGTVDYPAPLGLGQTTAYEVVLLERLCDGVRYRPLAGFPEYEVGDDGSMWSSYRSERHQLRPYTSERRYPKVTLRRDGKNHYRDVHRLVLEAFVGPCPTGYEGAHGDGDPTNNALGNLRWATPAENSADRERHGTAPQGERNPRAKLTQAAAAAIRQALANGESQRRLATRYGVSRYVIQLIQQGKLWRTADWPAPLGLGEVTAYELTLVATMGEALR